jgi:co-chaperonin GroES (HSP10)
MAEVKIPRGKILVKLNATTQDPEVAVGTVVDHGPPSKGVLGEEMVIPVGKGDEVFFDSMGTDRERIDLDNEPHIIIDTYQVKMLRTP